MDYGIDLRAVAQVRPELARLRAGQGAPKRASRLARFVFVIRNGRTINESFVRPALKSEPFGFLPRWIIIRVFIRICWGSRLTAVMRESQTILVGAVGSPGPSPFAETLANWRYQCGMDQRLKWKVQAQSTYCWPAAALSVPMREKIMALAFRKVPIQTTAFSFISN